MANFHCTPNLIPETAETANIPALGNGDSSLSGQYFMSHTLEKDPKNCFIEIRTTRNIIGPQL